MTRIQTIYVKNEELWSSVEKIRWRDKKSISELVSRALEDYVKHHLDGNETYTLDDPIIATPAFFRSFSIWEKYYLGLKDNEEADHRFKLQELIGLHKKRFGRSSI